jgi:hypothetical protein
MSIRLLTETHRGLTRLADAAQVIGKAAGEPQLYGPPERQWWRYPEEGPLQIIAVEAARVVSGLNGCIHLIHAAHFVGETNIRHITGSESGSSEGDLNQWLLMEGA